MILVCILSYRRPLYLARTLEAFIHQNGELFGATMKMIALDQCTSPETAAVFSAHREYFERVYCTSDINLGIGWGFSQLVELSRLQEVEYLLFLEDDWLCQVSLRKYLESIYELFHACPGVGVLRLRSIEAAVASVNHVILEQVRKEPWGHDFLVGNYHYVFNPHLVRSKVAQSIIPVSSEHHAQIRYNDLGLKAAQLVDRMFVHIGTQRAPGRISRAPFPEPVISRTMIPDTGELLVPLPVREASYR
jgi:hypothetical protein